MRGRHVYLSAAWLALSAVWAAAVFAQAPLSGRLKDFQAPGTDEAGRKFNIKGKDAAHIGNGVFQITSPHVDTFKADGAPDMTIDAAECFFNNDKSKIVWSERELSVKRADAGLSIQGRGFRWQPMDSTLTISNAVEAIIRRQALVDPVQSNSAAESVIRVFSERMEHRPDLVTFSGNVRVLDPQGEVRCETLRVRFDANNSLREIEALDDVILTQGETVARGRRAVYNTASGLLRLFEKTSWRMGDRIGSSELLILDRTKNTIRAETAVTMEFPSSLLETNSTLATAAQTNMLTISADTFDYAPTNQVTRGPMAIYNGNVRAIDPQAALDCELLTIFFDASNRLARAVADRSVVIRNADVTINGARARFENDEVTVTGSPGWRMQDKRGTSETLTFNPRTREVRARQVRMEIPMSSTTNFLSGAANAPATSPTEQASTNVLVITSAWFTNINNVATFSENVRASEARGQIDANSISVTFNDESQAERILATGDVILTEIKSQALGQEADYDIAKGIIHLRGNPKMMTENRQIIAREFVVDRKESKFQPLAPFYIQLRGLKLSSGR